MTMLGIVLHVYDVPMVNMTMLMICFLCFISAVLYFVALYVASLLVVWLRFAALHIGHRAVAPVFSLLISMRTRSNHGRIHGERCRGRARGKVEAAWRPIEAQWEQ